MMSFLAFWCGVAHVMSAQVDGSCDNPSNTLEDETSLLQLKREQGGITAPLVKTWPKCSKCRKDCKNKCKKIHGNDKPQRKQCQKECKNKDQKVVCQFPKCNTKRSKLKACPSRHPHYGCHTDQTSGILWVIQAHGAANTCNGACSIAGATHCDSAHGVSGYDEVADLVHDIYGEQCTQEDTCWDGMTPANVGDTILISKTLQAGGKRHCYYPRNTNKFTCNTEHGCNINCWITENKVLFHQLCPCRV